MPDSTALPRFCAYAVNDGRSHGHSVEAQSFAEAAMAFAEVWHPEPDDAGEVTVIVLDQESGEQQCYVVDLAHGEVEPCN
ncbi:MAG TPA: DUF5961 family protein [Phenylobacterium sp.]